MSLFTRVQSTPVLDFTNTALYTASGSVNVANWCQGGLAAPTVCLDPADASYPYKMEVSGWNNVAAGSGGQKWSCAFFKSADLKAWTMIANSIIAPAGNSTSGIYIHGNGSLIKIGSTFYHYYVAYVRASQTSQLFLETSTDLVTWTQQNGGTALLTLGATGSGEDTLQYDFSVFYNPTSTKYELWYATNDSVQPKSMFRADSVDGIAFTKQGRQFYQQPWMVGGFGEPYPNMSAAGLKFVTLDAGVSGTRQPGFGLYDGRQWQFVPNCIAYGAGSSWDNTCIFDTANILTDTGDGNGLRLYMLYAGAQITSSTDNTQSSIGLAYAPVPVLPTQPVSASKTIPGQFNPL